MKDRKYRNSAWLTKKYWVEKLSINKIAKECGVHLVTIRYWFEKHNIQRRSQKKAILLKDDYYSGFSLSRANATYRNKKWLERKRLKEGWSMEEIAFELGVSDSTICYWLKKFGIKSGRVRRGKTYVSVLFYVPESIAIKVKQYCEKKEIERSEFIRKLIIERMLKDGFNPYRQREKKDEGL